MKNILLAVTGGIAAYKAIDLTSKLTQANYDVRVMLTDHAQEFVTPLAFQAISRNPVYTNTFIEENPEDIQHIALGDWADCIVVAPATANTIAKLSVGIADDIVTSTLLATETPKFIAPAMNVHMYENKRTQHNISVLKDDEYHFIEPGTGVLIGRYSEKKLLAYVSPELHFKNNISGFLGVANEGDRRTMSGELQFHFELQLMVLVF